MTFSVAKTQYRDELQRMQANHFAKRFLHFRPLHGERVRRVLVQCQSTRAAITSTSSTMAMPNSTACQLALR